MWEFVEKMKYEGLIMKDENSPYVDKRSNYWFKLKRFEETELKILSWEKGKNHGTFICSDGKIDDIRVSALSTKYVEDYLKMENKEVKIEIQYLNNCISNITRMKKVMRPGI